jgi:hypothetical protein
MNTHYNRRKFVKLTTTALAGAAVFPAMSYGCKAAGAQTGITVWDVPGGESLASPHYQVTLKRGRKSWRVFTYYTFSKGVDKIIDHEGERNYVKLGFLRMHSNEFIPSEKNKDTYAHSWACFDVAGGPVEVEIKILQPVSGITFPLQSCGVFPSSLGIECEIIAVDTVRFTMEKSAKIAVVPNYRQALEQLEELNPKEALEGYRNPLFLFARNPESNIPDKDSEGTLLVKPGELYLVDDFDNADTIFFEAGIHDYSNYNPNDPNHYIRLNKGQTLYLAGGAYLYGIVRSDAQRIIDKPIVRGRGTLSGDKQPWTGVPTSNNLIINVRLEGIQIADPHNHIGGGNAPFKDIALVGGWHGNTDGLGKNSVTDDPFDGWHMEDCFSFAADTNMYVGGNARIRNHTIWQLNNAEPAWIRNVKDAAIDGLYIIAYNRFRADAGRPGQTFNLAHDYRRPEMTLNSIRVTNALVDAPFVGRLFLITADLDSDEIIYKDILFENITVKTPYIKEKSLIGIKGDKKAAFGKVVFRNLVINGTRVTGDNFTDYFEMLNGVTIGKEIIVE